MNKDQQTPSPEDKLREAALATLNKNIPGIVDQLPYMHFNILTAMVQYAKEYHEAQKPVVDITPLIYESGVHEFDDLVKMFCKKEIELHEFISGLRNVYEKRIIELHTSYLRKNTSSLQPAQSEEPNFDQFRKDYKNEFSEYPSTALCLFLKPYMRPEISKKEVEEAFDWLADRSPDSSRGFGTHKDTGELANEYVVTRIQKP